MPKTATKPSQEWTPDHESALSGLTGMGIPKKEARAHLEVLPGADVAELMRQALASRSRGQKPPPAIPGGPRGAVPLNPQPAAAAPPPPAPPAAGAPQPQPPPKGPSMRDMLLAKAATVAPQPSAAPKRDLFNRIADTVFGGGPPKAPIGPALKQAPSPAAAQTQPAVQPGSTEKPRIRVRAAGTRIPPAPIGKTAATEAPGAEEPEAPAETKEKAPPLPLIRSKEEYEQLAPGTEFIWASDSHIYEKPAEKTAEA